MKLMVTKTGSISLDAPIPHLVLDVIKLKILWLDKVVHGFGRRNQWFMEYHGSGLVFGPTSEPTLELNLEPFSTDGTFLSFDDFNNVWSLSIEQRW